MKWKLLHLIQWLLPVDFLGHRVPSIRWPHSPKRTQLRSRVVLFGFGVWVLPSHCGVALEIIVLCILIWLELEVTLGHVVRLVRYLVCYSRFWLGRVIAFKYRCSTGFLCKKGKREDELGLGSTPTTIR